MVLSISLAVLLVIIVIMMIRKSGLKAGHAILCALAGFFLASSSIAPTITNLTSSLAGMIGNIKF
ncbi:DUF2304 family protein [Streptomyces sp. NBC_01497]|uniref:DUF2304 family protein n=1 Tax=Streptomyces sp. NBC_01497 TaxID=2903885 RepID=UPI002E337600|nr:DUF2304 family protein [Streptomyces sp. NBC_01497]